MNAPDTNVLLFAHDLRSPFHLQAREFLLSSLHQSAPFGLPLPCVHGFIRIATSKILGASALDLPTALQVVKGWISRPNVQILYPGPRHWNLLEALSLEGAAGGALFSDAVIAAIVQEHNAVLQTNDRDFARFPKLKWENPFRPASV